MDLKDAAQKTKVNWAIEGDENSKFFHGVINKRRSQLAIRGVFVSGDWYTNPSKVKEVFYDHFAARFKQPSRSRLKLCMPFPNHLSPDQVGDLGNDISSDEIRKAVWDYGESKSLGLDGFTFEFFRRYWHFIGSDFCSAVNCFFDKGCFSRGGNSSFIAMIPKVMDAKFIFDFRPISLIDDPFILNEVLAWCKRKRKQALVFKVDFAKAYYSVRWDFLLDVLLAFGFGPKWYQWIRGILSSNMASILVNGSPTSEFPIFSGLKQGDPLAPFLFILVMESFHLSVSRAVNDGIFKGLHITGLTSLSHLYYADDAIFIGEWSFENMDNLLMILRCFQFVSGLSINVNKSHLLGVGVPLDIVHQGASRIGCEVMRTPFKYLGVMDGDHMSRYSAWSNTIQKVHARLSKWKGVILREVHQLALKGFDFPSHCKIRIRDGLNTRFWLDTWTLDLPLCVRFPRLFAFEFDKEISISAKWGAPSFDDSFRRQVRDRVERNQWSELLSLLGTISLSPSSDRYFCNLNGDGVFRVKDIRFALDELFIPSSDVATRWVKFVPIKILVTYSSLAIWERASLREFVVGGTFNGRRSRRLSIGIHGSVLYTCSLSLKPCWRVFIILLGGTSGLFEIGWFLTLPLLDGP
nr:RNA-directed DNA polymerase, eukaryota [Tanacetum cinerariifolium]